MKKFSVLILVLLVFSSLWEISAMAAQLGGQPLGSVENVVVATGVAPAIVLSTYLTENNLYQVSNPIITANESGGGCNERINRVNFLKYYHR